jgi:hypothetical protein
VNGYVVIHAAHGRPGMAIGDGLLRLFVPLVGALIGSAVSTSSSCGSNTGIAFGTCSLDGAFVGGALGASIPVALDAGFFAYRTHDANSPPVAASTSWFVVDTGPHRVSALVSGQF